MDYKIIATDLDGTLCNDSSIIPDENISAMKKAMDAGIKMVICSGRSHFSIMNFASYTGLNQKGCYGISFNGSIVYEADTMKVIHEDRLNVSNARYILNEIKKINAAIPLLVYVEGDLIACEHDVQEIQAYTDRSKLKYVTVDNFDTYLDKDIMKVLIHTDNNEMIHQIYDGMIDKLDGKCSMFFSGPNMLEFSSTQSNKAIGVKVLADYLNVDMGQVICIGDNYNDVEMVEEAGFGVAVNNAVEELKQKADYVTKADNNNGAVAEVIHMVLENKI